MRLMLKALLNDIYGITIDKQKSRKLRLKRRKMQQLILGPEMQAKKKGGWYLSGVMSLKYLVTLGNGK